MIEIEGVESLRDAACVIPDRIEAATYILAAAVPMERFWFDKQERSSRRFSQRNVRLRDQCGKQRQGRSSRWRFATEV